ncbi:MAG: methyltransferase [Hirschia sp.]|nr:methyltransferase [Hirschia sp.]MBF18734.1 methyltransferase [Hirschia sp.]
MTDIHAEPTRTGLYGEPPAELVEIPADARQCSPLIPGSAALEEAPERTLDRFILAAPGGLQERRHVLALALKALKPGGDIIAIAPKKKGGQRLAGDLESLGCTDVSISSKSHCKIAQCTSPDDLTAINEAIAAYGPRLDEDLGLWTRPGVFAWDRVDPATALLMDTMPDLAGRGADLGCGLGILAHRVLQSEAVTELTLVDIDRRAVEMAWRNVGDDRVKVRWEDARTGLQDISGLDFIVMNPPFHEGGDENRSLGQAFIKSASKLLRKGGKLWLTANRHLPYEATLDDCFSSWTKPADQGGYKIIEATR